MIGRFCKCGRLVQGECTCQAAKRRRYTHQDKNKSYTYAWDVLSRRKRQANPLCEECLQHGMRTPATEVHHIEKVTERPDLVMEWTNLRSMCAKCHRKADKEV